MSRVNSRRSTRLSHDGFEFGRSLGTVGVSTTHTRVHAAGAMLSSSGDIGLPKISLNLNPGADEPGIAVTTILEQEIETLNQQHRGSFGEDESIRRLFNNSSDMFSSHKDMV